MAACTLLLDHSAPVNACEEQRWTPLHVAVNAGRESVVALLLSRGAAASARTAHGDTPLSLCEDDEALGQLLLAARELAAPSADALNTWHWRVRVL